MLSSEDSIWHALSFPKTVKHPAHSKPPSGLVYHNPCMITRNCLRLAVFLAGVNGAWGQPLAIASVTNLSGDARINPSGSAQIFGTWPADGARNFTVTVGSLPGVVGLSWIVRNTPRELDIEVPAGVHVGNTTIVISHLGVNSNAFPVTIVPYTPVVDFNAFTAFQHLSGQPITPSSPAAPGEVATTFMSGLGLTNPPWPTGTAVTSFIPTATTPVVTLAGKPVALTFAGLYPGGRTGGYQVSFTVPADAPSGPQPVVVGIGGVNSNTQTIFVGTQPLPNPPVISAVANGASFSTKGDLSPGSFVSIFASGLGNSDNLAAFPATTVNGISVLVNGKLAPIFHLIASQGQINALVPTDADIGASTSVVVQNQNGPSKSTSVTAYATGPGIFTIADPSDSTRRSAIATLANTAWLALPASQTKALGLPNCAGLDAAVQCGQPVRRGDFVQLFTTGLGKATPNGDPNGAVLPSDASAPISGNPLYYTVVSPTVTVGGVAAKVVFSGLAPGYNGLYQVDFQIPLNAPTGDSVPLIISMPASVVDSATIAIGAQ